jgi:hypothetical protein
VSKLGLGKIRKLYVVCAAAAVVVLSFLW